MEPIFTLPYSELATIEEFQRKIPRTACYLPMSRQQKSVDFILQPQGKKFLRIQVKSSKAYYDGRRNIDRKEFSHHLWLNNPLSRHKRGSADWFVIFGMYARVSDRSTRKLRNQRDWQRILICLREREVFKFIDESSKFANIYFNVDEKGRIKDCLGERGFKKHTKLNRYLLQNRIAQFS